jgi:signal transduction histidine kinase
LKQRNIALKEVAPEKRQRSRTSTRERELTYQREMLESIGAIGSLLRLNLHIDALLEQVTAKTCEALHAPSGVLYLANSAATFRLRGVCGLSSAQAEYLRHRTVQDTTIALLTNETFLLGNFYLIPATSLVWQKDIFSAYFTQSKESETGDQSQKTTIWEHETVAILPLRRTDATLFGLFVLSAKEEQFLSSIEQMNLLAPLLHQIEMVIEEARMFEAARRSSEERAALIEIGRALSSPDALREPETVYQTIYTQVKSIMPADAFFVSRYYENPQSMWMEYLIDEEVVYEPFQYSAVPEWIEGILRRETPGLLFSTSEEYNAFTQTIYPVDDDDIIGGSRPSQSLLFVPVHYGDEIIGMLSAQSYQQYAYTQHHMEVLKEIAVHAGIALVNARVNRELRDAMKQAQESERLKNHFLMVASHELRTPLTSIQGYLELLGDFEETLSKAKKHRFISLARRASEELVLLLNNIMDASRLDQDRVLLKVEAVQVRQAAQLIVEILEPTIVREARNVQVLVAEDLYIQADELRFRQILLNLLGNALKYTKHGTPITIHAEPFSWSSLVERVPAHQRDTLPTEGNAIVVSVRDRGDGIHPEEQKRLFVKFMRLPGALNSTQRGAGLGLYLCRELVEEMNGSIWVESSGVAGEGTTFSVALPQHDDRRSNIM